MPDDFISPPRAVPCVPRRPAVPVADGPREADEQPVGKAQPDEMEQARQARDLLNRLVAEGKLRMWLVACDMPGGPDMLELRRLVPRVEYDEVALP